MPHGSGEMNAISMPGVLSLANVVNICQIGSGGGRNDDEKGKK